MQRTADSPRIGNWSAFILLAAGSCLVGFIAPHWYHRHRLALIDVAILGAFAGQFLWSAAWCALGQGRWICRYLAVVAAGIVIAGALIAGIALKPETEMERRTAQTDRATGHEFTRRERARNEVWHYGLGFPLSLLVCQLPLVWNRSYRGWRIVFRGAQSQSPEAELLKFGLSDLLGATAGAAIAFGFWRLGISEVSRGSYGTVDALVASFFCVFLSLIAGSLVLPIVPFVLGDRPRRLALATAGVYLIGIVIVLTGALLFLDSSVRSLQPIAAISSYLAAIASSALVVFWIARELGYRLLQERRRGMTKQHDPLKPRCSSRPDESRQAASLEGIRLRSRAP
jgi:hypothetical protein